MDQPLEKPRELLAPDDLTQLTKYGIAVTRASDLVQRGPELLEGNERRWENLVLDLKAQIFQSGDMEVYECAAILTALEIASPGMDTSKITETAGDLLARYEATHAALSEPGILVMGYEIPHGEAIFKSAGTGLKLSVRGRDSKYKFRMHTEAIDAKSEIKLVSINETSAQNLVTDPEEASNLNELRPYSERHKPRLVVGAEAIAANLAGDKSGTFPVYKWEVARSLGFRFEEINPTLREQYENQRARVIKIIANDIFRYEGHENEYFQNSYIERLREQYERVEFFGGSKADVEKALSDLIADRHAIVYGLLDTVTSMEDREPAQVD